MRVLVAGPKLVVPAKQPNPAGVQALERKEHGNDLDGEWKCKKSVLGRTHTNNRRNNN